MNNLVEKLATERTLTDSEFLQLLSDPSGAWTKFLFEKAVEKRKEYYGNQIYIRGLIEVSSYCKNNCLYCGIRCGNNKAERYRLSKAEIIECCDSGYELGFRTFVLQGGEDPCFTDAFLVDLIQTIKQNHPDTRITLSLGERSDESYEKLKQAGADRYLLRHETANAGHYSQLHPQELTLEHRIRCLWSLKKLGYQVGTGFMVGSPFQTLENLVEDLRLIEKLQPEMIGIGPYITHKDTPFCSEKSGSVELTVILLSILRLMQPNLLLPATTALATLKEDGRVRGILAGANVIMPNLSPPSVRAKYALYNNKKSSGEEAAEALAELAESMKQIGYNIVVDVGDSKTLQPNKEGM